MQGPVIAAIDPFLLAEIFSFLPPLDLLRVAACCKQWYQVARQDRCWHRHKTTVLRFCPQLYKLFQATVAKHAHLRLCPLAASRCSKPWITPAGHWHTICRELWAPMHMDMNKWTKRAAWKNPSFGGMLAFWLMRLVAPMQSNMLGSVMYVGDQGFPFSHIQLDTDVGYVRIERNNVAWNRPWPLQKLYDVLQPRYFVFFTTGQLYFENES